MNELQPNSMTEKHLPIQTQKGPKQQQQQFENVSSKSRETYLSYDEFKIR
jgi:hypothetical protein